MQLLEVELYFDDAGRFHPSTQDVLFSRQVVCRSNAAKAVKKTTAQHDRTLSTTSMEKLGYLQSKHKQKLDNCVSISFVVNMLRSKVILFGRWALSLCPVLLLFVSLLTFDSLSNSSFQTDNNCKLIESEN